MRKPKSTHASSAKRITDIMQAALHCFTELGFNDTTMADICGRANASTGSVYHYFKSKEQLAAAVYLEGIGKFQTGMLQVLENEDDARRGVISVVEYHIKWVSKNPEWSGFLFNKKILSFVSETEVELLEMNKKFITGLSLWFKHQMDTEKIRRVPWDILVAILLGPCQEYTKLYLSGKTITKINEAANDLGIAAWNSLSK